MGREIQPIKISGEDRRKYREKVRRSLDVFARMLREGMFDSGPSCVGLEIELNLVDYHGLPTMRNAEVLEAIADPVAWSTEVGQFNLEINVPPRQLAGDALAELELQIRGSLNAADEAARRADARLVMIGILPTLTEEDTHEGTLSASERYKVLNEQIFAARGEDMRIEINGAEQLLTHAGSITPEAACTSVQLHIQVAPEAFASYWNAAQAIAGVQVALAANSPFLFGKQLWQETRITLFEQATDTRPDELKHQGVRPRVWFGERWITSVFDLFEENLRYFPALLPICEDEDPLAMLDSGACPQLAEMSLHNGTIYRWNRPVYAVVDGKPHLRVENRVLPAGPSVADVVANAAFYFGLVRALAEAQRPVWSQMSFATAAENLYEAARSGIDAHLYWPGVGDVPAAELVLRRLLPLARDGLSRWGVDASHADRLLGIIEQRCLSGRNGAAWQIGAVGAVAGGPGQFGAVAGGPGQFDAVAGGPGQFGAVDAGRREALRQMTERYIELMHTNEPVHTWPSELQPAVPGLRFGRLEVAVHDQESYVALGGVVKALGDRGQYFEAEGAPQPDRVRVGLGYGVELHRAIAVRARLIDRVGGEGAADATAGVAGADHEAGVGDVGAGTTLVAVRLGGAGDRPVVSHRDEGPAGRGVHPHRARRLFAGVAIPAECLARRDDRLHDGPDLWPVLFGGVPDQHASTLAD